MIKPRTIKMSGYDILYVHNVLLYTDNGHPLYGVVKIVIPSDTKNVFDEEELNLYFRTVFYTKFGKSIIKVIDNFCHHVRNHLITNILDDRLDVGYFRYSDMQDVDSIYNTKLLSNAVYFDIKDFPKMEEIDIKPLYDDNNIFKKSFAEESKSQILRYDTGYGIIGLFQNNEDNIYCARASTYIDVQTLTNSGIENQCEELYAIKYSDYDDGETDIIVGGFSYPCTSITKISLRYTESIDNKLYNKYINEIIDVRNLYCDGY